MRISLIGAGVLVVATSASGAGRDWDVRIAQAFARVDSASAMKVAAGPTPKRDLTLLLIMARQHWDELSPETRALAAPWLSRPTDDAGDDVLGMAIEYTTPVSTFDTSHFRIHYVTATEHAASPEFVALVAAEMEFVYESEYAFGFRAVTSDGTRGGDGRYDVYLADLGHLGVYGYTASEGASSYLVLDNDYASDQFRYDEPIAPLRVTAAHEYFHAIQFGYDLNEDPAFMEQSSTWMEDMVYPEIHDNYQYIGEPFVDLNGNGQADPDDPPLVDHNGNGIRDEGSVDYPEVPLDGFDTPPMIQYGRFLWPRYLTERFPDANIMRAAWENCGEHRGPNPFSAVADALPTGMTLKTAFQEYAAWSYDTARFADGANYPRPWVDGSTTTVADFSSGTTPSLAAMEQAGFAPQMHLSSIYEQVLSPSGLYTFAFSGGDPAVTMIVDPGDGQLRHEPVTISNGIGVWTASGAARVIAVISNASGTEDCMGWVFRSGSASVSDVDTVRCPSGDGDGGGGGALDLGLLAIILGVVRRRRKLNEGID